MHMPVRKLSIALDPDLAEAAGAAAEEEGLSFSAYLARALERQLTIRRGLAAVRSYEAEYGVITDDEMDAARREIEEIERRERGPRAPAAK